MLMASGLLWYDDDTRRPLALKVAEAAQRYRERVGYEPTTCQLNPKLMPAPASTVRKRSSAARVPEIMLRLEPNEHLRPNYLYVGVLEGERLRRAKDSMVRARRLAKASNAAAKPATKARKTEVMAESATLQVAEPVSVQPKRLKKSAPIAAAVATESPKKKIAAKSAKTVETKETTISAPKVEEKQDKPRTRIAAKAQAKQLTTAPEVTPVARSTKAKQTKTITQTAPQVSDIVPAVKKRSVKATTKRSDVLPAPAQPVSSKQPETAVPPVQRKKSRKAAAAAIQPLSLWDTPAPATVATSQTPKRATKPVPSTQLSRVKKTAAEAPAPASEHRPMHRRTA